MTQHVPHLPAALFFDFDGVIVDSNAVKAKAFATLFADFPEHLPAILEMNRHHGGVNRLVKFDWIYRDILKRPLVPAHRAAMGERFSALTNERVIACPMVPGAFEALERWSARLPLHMVSGTSQHDLEIVVKARGLDRFFQGLHGGPRTKTDILTELVTQSGGDPRRTAMVGDAITDYDAAKDVGARFVGIVHTGDDSPFPTGTPIWPDLTSFDAAIGQVFAD